MLTKTDEHLKVVHLSNTDIRGGASRAGYGIKNAVCEVNPGTLFVTQRKFSKDENVISVSSSPIEKQLTNVRMLIDLLQIKSFTYTVNGRFSFADIGKDISDIKEIRMADILHLHWINEGFLSFRSLIALSKLNKPIVWTFHDMWAFTGGCHYSSGCLRYEDKCGFCPYLKYSGENDSSRKIWQKKSRLYDKMNLTIVTPSNWMKKCAQNSSLLKDLHVDIIPYAIDTEIYKPIEKSKARALFNLSEEKIILLFGTMNTGEVRKGYHLLINTLSKLNSDHPDLKDKIEILVVGSASAESQSKVPYRMHFTGRLHNEEKLVNSYNAADLFIAPSLEDNYPNTVMESLACGVPVVAFNIGGMPDMILNRQNGVLVNDVSSDALSDGINWMIGNCKSENIKKSARTKILTDNLPSTIGKKYMELYNKLHL